MPTASDFGIAAVQAVIFTPDVVSFSPPKVLAGFLQRHGQRYDGDVTSLPLPADAPSQLPRVLLQSADSTWRLQASPARIDSIWTPTSLTGADNLAGAVVQCGEVLEDYVREYSVRVGRLALVVQRALVVSEPAQILVRHFCDARLVQGQEAPLKKSDDFELHNRVRYPFPPIEQDINSWVRCKATVLVLGEPGIIIEQDLNTLEEGLKDNEFSPEMIRTFLTEVQVEADKILRRYFPKEG